MLVPSETTFIVVRHGESDANSRGVISDKDVDHPLTDLGITQAKETAELIKYDQIDLIISSTRERAIRTAQIINEFHKAQIVLSHDLVERDYGVFSGVNKLEARTIMAHEGFEWMEIPQSETADALDDRVRAAISTVMKHHIGKRILVSTHEDIVRSFFRVVDAKSVRESATIAIENSCPYVFVIKAA